jgi:hypothetical protein
MQCAHIGFGKNRDGTNAHRSGGTGDPAGDLATVRNEQSPNHGQ